MQISSIKIYQHDLPVKGKPYKMANIVLDHLDTTIVEISTDDGTTGYGETCPLGPVYQPHHALGARAALEGLCPHLIGLNPLHIQNVNYAMDDLLNGHRYAKSAIDIALWDICGKYFNMRVCDLLGGAVRESVPSYYAVGVHPLNETVEIVKAKQAEGYPRIQLKAGGRPVDEDIAIIRKVSEILDTGVRLTVDVNRAWTTRDALLVSLACQDVSFVMEQPCNSYEEIISIRQQIRHPLYIDENTENIGVILKAIGDCAADGFGLKLSRLGGISSMRTARDVCREINKPITCDDSWGGDIVAAACVHLGATVLPHILEGVWIAAPYIDTHYDTGNGIDVVNGHITLPKGSGLGITPDTSIFGEPIMKFG